MNSFKALKYNPINPFIVSYHLNAAHHIIPHLFQSIGLHNYEPPSKKQQY